MAFIIIPSRSRRLPNGPVKLRQNHSLVSDGTLKALWVPDWSSNNSLVELVSGSVDSGTGSILPASLSGDSRGLDFTAAANYVDCGARAINRAGVAGAEHISVMALVIPGVLTRGDVITRWTTGGGAGDQFNLLYGLTSGKAKFYTANGGGGTDNSGDGATTLVVGNEYMLGGSAFGTTYRNVYVNGKLDGQVTVALALMNVVPTTNYRIGDNANTDGNFTGKFSIGGVFGSALDDAVFAEMYVNPYQLVEPIMSRVYFLPGVAVAVLPKRSTIVNQAVNRAANF